MTPLLRLPILRLVRVCVCVRGGWGEYVGVGVGGCVGGYVFVLIPVTLPYIHIYVHIYTLTRICVIWGGYD